MGTGHTLESSGYGPAPDERSDRAVLPHSPTPKTHAVGEHGRDVLLKHEVSGPRVEIPDHSVSGFGLECGLVGHGKKQRW